MLNMYRLLSMALLGFSSGLPLALTASTLQAWMTVSGLDLVMIGFLQWTGQPYVYKFFWAPLLDRYNLWPRLGLRRSWMLLTQLGVMGIIFVISTIDPSLHPFVMMGWTLVLALFSATQDIAIDGVRMVVLNESERGIGSACYVAGYRVGMLVSGALALILAERFSWPFAYQVMGGLMGVGICATLFLKEPLVVAVAPNLLKDSPQSPWRLFWEPVKTLIRHPYFYFFLGIALTYKLADAFALSLSTAFLIRGVGYTVTQVGLVNKVAGLAAAILGAMAGGWLLSRIELWRGLFWFAVLQGVSNIGFALLLFLPRPDVAALFAVVTIDQFVGGMGTAAFMAFLMSLCHKQFAATQYTFWSAISAAGRVYIGPLAGWVASSWGWLVYFGISVLWAVPTLVLIWMVRRRLDSGVTEPALQPL